MTRFLFKSAITLAVLLTVMILVRNYFWGSTEEQQRSREIFGQVSQLTESVVDLLRVEKEEFHNGKYDEALAKVNSMFVLIRNQAVDMGDEGLEYLQRVAELEEREQQLEDRLRNLESGNIRSTEGSMPTDSGALTGVPFDEAQAIRNEILNLNEETERLTFAMTQSRHRPPTIERSTEEFQPNLSPPNAESFHQVSTAWVGSENMWKHIQGTEWREYHTRFDPPREASTWIEEHRTHDTVTLYDANRRYRIRLTPTCVEANFDNAPSIESHKCHYVLYVDGRWLNTE